MAAEGEYLLSHVGFSPDNTPRITLQQGDDTIRFDPTGQVLTLRFDTSRRFCCGWHDLKTGVDSVCPDTLIVETKYDQCPACQKRTGFNPAFYHAASVSPQQEARNQESHFLYLAYFADNLVKVGISYAKRGNARLLEQGARSALILDTFPTAHIARHYEAKIAAMAGISETLQLAKKISLLSEHHDPKQAKRTLETTRSRIEEALNVRFTPNEVQSFDTTYFHATPPRLATTYDCSPHHFISGQVIGMLGSILLCYQQETPVLLALKKYIGHKVTLSYTETPIDLPAQQAALF
jgi:hypothetical protein